MSNTSMAIAVYGTMAALLALGFAFNSKKIRLDPAVLHLGLWAVAFGILGIGLWVRKHPKEIGIDVMSDGLVVHRRGATFFPLGEATLGQWIAGMYGIRLGTTLCLKKGRHRFVLGGENHRIATGTPLQAAPSRTVDAQMPGSDFDRLLAVISPACGFSIRPAAIGEPIRCLLLPNAAKFFSTARFAITQKPRLALDVGEDAIWVIDLQTNTLIASAWMAQVIAMPAMHKGRSRGDVTMPALVVRVPGLAPLIIGLPDRRYAWPGAVNDVDKPTYVMSGADWLTFLDTFGPSRAARSWSVLNTTRVPSLLGSLSL